ncbi:hypothetical protein DAMA08_030910 [Martiniozyma asiatica (nom. inval.)]|nr:hypothetical protein DAMA08_030910 [Martiniozyma asiatica]
MVAFKTRYLTSRLSKLRHFSSTIIANDIDFSHTVIGAGVVGLAVGAVLAKQSPTNSVLIIEKNETFGQETSSRNSEVVHAGLYYPEDSLKTKFCIQGKNWIYENKDKFPVRQCGKWIIAQTDEEEDYLMQLHQKSKRIGVSTEFIPLELAKRLEPKVVARKAILNSPTTGITSSHSIMEYLLTDFKNNNGEIAFGTKVSAIQKIGGAGAGFEIKTTSGESGEQEQEQEFVVRSNYVVNCAGLQAAEIHNMVKNDYPLEMFYAKGNYFSYNGPKLGVERLLYPCPTPGVASLGTHLTIDLGGQVKFGPDLEWLPETPDWSGENVYKVNSANLKSAYLQVTRYLPDIKLENLNGSYSGIRPKLVPKGKSAHDFFVKGYDDGFVTVAGIESPGLTAAYAIGLNVGQFFR